MSLPVFQATIVNDSGDIIPSAVITVLDEITGLGLTVYSNRAGTVPLGTNGVFTAGTDGFAQFFAPAGNYRVKAEQAASGFEKTWDFVPLVGTAAFVDLSYFGTAARANVQADPTDTTAGALMAVGAFGLGGVVTSTGTDLSAGDYIISGKYVTASSTMSNAPSDYTNGRHTIEVIGSVLGYKTQVLYGNQNIDQGKIWSRAQNGATWSDWQPVYTGANLNPNVFGGDSTGVVSDGYANSTSTAVFTANVMSNTSPVSITVLGSFSVYDATDTLIASGKVPLLGSIRSNRVAPLVITGLSGMTAKENLTLRPDSAASKITVNF